MLDFFSWQKKEGKVNQAWNESNANWPRSPFFFEGENMYKKIDLVSIVTHTIAN